MAEHTTNLNLIKPDYSEDGDVSDINENMDKIDAAVKANQDGITALQTGKINTPSGVAEGQFLQTDENGDPVWGDPADQATIISATESWLSEHVNTNEFAVDDTLLIAGDAADSKVTGEKISGLKSALNVSEEVANNGFYQIKSSDIVQGGWVQSTPNSNADRIRSAFMIKVEKGNIFKCKNPTLKVYVNVLETKTSAQRSQSIGWLDPQNDYYEEVINYDGYINIVLKNSAETAILPSDYDCDISIVSNMTNTIEGLLDDLTEVEKDLTKVDNAFELVLPDNIFNKNDKINGYTIGTSSANAGKLVENSNYCATGFFRVFPNKTYYSYTGQNATERSVEAFFYSEADENTYLSMSSGTKFTTPVGCNYVRFSFANTVWEAHSTYLHITETKYQGYTAWAEPYYSIPKDEELYSITNKHEETIYGNIKAVWEYGTIDNTSVPFTYSDTDSRVRIGQNNAIWLTAGSVVGFDSYDDVRFFVAGVDKQGNNTSLAWQTSDLTIRYDGYYHFVLSTVPEATITSIPAITERFFIKECESLENIVIARNPNLISIAHQGYSADDEYYGHSRISAFINAKKNYFDCGETDVVFSSDNVPMCCHDTTFVDSDDGTTVITISQHTAAELQTYGYYGEKIATLDEVVSVCKKIGLGLVIDKLSRVSTDEQWATIFNIVQKYQMQDSIIFAIESEANGVKVLDWYSDAKIFFVSNTINQEALAIIGNLRTWYSRKNGIDIDVNYNNISQIAEAYESLPIGVKLYLWTIDNAQGYINRMNYCAGITSNKVSANKFIV